MGGRARCIQRTPVARAATAQDNRSEDLQGQAATTRNHHRIGTFPQIASAIALRQRVTNGDFDATSEESEAWAAGPEGQDAFNQLTKRKVMQWWAWWLLIGIAVGVGMLYVSVLVALSGMRW